ncbi:hypothetical protein E4T56_gene15341, partial [Termitomyces sp. T112]
EEVGVDGGVEARIVELEAQIVAALVGALGPGGADFRAADQNPVAGGVLAGGAGVGDEAHALGLDAAGYDFAGDLVRAGLLEGADGRHCRRRPTPHRLRPEQRGGWQERLCCFARNDGLGRQGKKVGTRRCGIGGRGAAVLR